MLTFNRIGDIFAVNVHSNQTPIVILHFPFVVNDIFQLNFGATALMGTIASRNNDICTFNFDCVLLFSAREFANPIKNAYI